MTQQQVDYYENAAKGRASMIIVEAIAVAERYSSPEAQLRTDHVKFMAGLKRLVETTPLITWHVNLSFIALELSAETRHRHETS